MQLPRSNGWDFAAAVRLRGKHIPTIVVTGRHDARLCAEAVEAEGYFAKPFNCSALLEEVKRLTRRRTRPNSRGTTNRSARVDDP